MDRVMAVMTSDYRYAKRFCDYVNRSGRLAVPAIPFNNTKSCYDYSKKHRIELLITDSVFPRLEQSGIEQIDASRKLVFADETEAADHVSESSAAGYMSGGNHVLDKYQSAEGLLCDIQGYIDDPRIFQPQKRAGSSVTVLGVYSPVMRCGKTSFALTLCRELSRKNKVLYINLEEFPPVLKLLGRGEKKEGLSEAVYCMKQGRLDAKSIRQFITSSAGMDWIAPASDPDDNSFISGEDYTALLNAIFELTSYEYLIIDMNRYSGQADMLIDLCNVVYMPGGSDRISRMKMDSFMEYVLNSKSEMWVSKLKHIELPAEITLTEAGAYLDKLLYGEMGDFARELCRA